MPSQTTITVRDNPALWWLVALLFIGVGAALVYLGLARADALPAWQGSLAAAMGLAAVTSGVWFAWRSPRSVVVICPALKEVRLTQVGLFGRRRTTHSFSEIREVISEYQADDEGAPMARPTIVLLDGTYLPLSALWHHDPEGIAQVVASIRAAVHPALGTGGHGDVG